MINSTTTTFLPLFLLLFLVETGLANSITLKSGSKIDYTGIGVIADGVNILVGGKQIIYKWNQIQPDTLPENIRSQHHDAVIAMFQKAQRELDKGQHIDSSNDFKKLREHVDYLTDEDRREPWGKDLDKKTVGQVEVNGKWMELEQALPLLGYGKFRGKGQWMPPEKYKAYQNELQKAEVAKQKWKEEEDAERQKDKDAQSKWNKDASELRANMYTSRNNLALYFRHMFSMPVTFAKGDFKYTCWGELLLGDVYLSSSRASVEFTLHTKSRGTEIMHENAVIAFVKDFDGWVLDSKHSTLGEPVLVRSATGDRVKDLLDVGLKSDISPYIEFLLHGNTSDAPKSASSESVRANQTSKSIADLRAAAEKGDSEAQYNLGLCYANGEGVAKDMMQAAKWYSEAAEQGNANAQCFLGFCYGTGDGKDKNDAEAVKWLRKAAEQGQIAAQYGLGLQYEYGKGVPKDKIEAMKWYRKAAEQGHALAQSRLSTEKVKAAREEEKVETDAIKQKQSENGEKLAKWVWEQIDSVQKYTLRSSGIVPRSMIQKLGSVYVADGDKVVLGVAYRARIEQFLFDVKYESEDGLILIKQATVDIGYIPSSTTATLLGVYSPGMNLSLDGSLAPVRDPIEVGIGNAINKMRARR